MLDNWLQVDCTKEVELCREHHITGFPSIRVFRKGSDDITVHGIHEHESYRGAGSPRAAASSCAPYHAKGQASAAADKWHNQRELGCSACI